MICLSKADGSLSRQLSWNQSPPRLTAANTTCQDLNGIVNLREHVGSGQDDGGGSNGTMSRLADTASLHGMHDSLPPTSWDGGAGRQSCATGLSSCQKTNTGGDDQIRPFRGTSYHVRASSTWNHVALYAVGAIVWVISVVAASLALSFWDLIPFRRSHGSHAIDFSTPLHQDLSASRPSSRKRNTCADGGVGDEYNTPLHVGALFIILTVSTLACAFPLLAVKFPGLRIPARFFFAVRHFGTGVLIATAFVHLIPTAFISLGDPCLDSFWTEDYPAIPGAISLAAIFFVVVIEMVFHPSRHIPPIELTSAEPDRSGSHTSMDRTSNMGMQPVRDMGPIAERSSSISHGLTALHSREDRMDSHHGQRADGGEQAGRKQTAGQMPAEIPPAGPAPALSKEQQHRRELLQCVLLEFGILFHSIFIGMAISVSIGSEFIILLIAIAFHQTFEGLALGSRIASIRWPEGKLQPWFMALAYGCTTPIGQAIGLATHTLYSPSSAVGLMVVGVMNAISAGLLVFASLVELLSEDLLSDQSWRFLRGRERVYACLLIFFGAFFMSLVGAWA